MHGAIGVAKKNAERPALYEVGQVVGFVDLIERGGEHRRFPMSQSARWFCAVTNPNCQMRAAMGLHEAGYRSFYPKARRWVSHARVKTAKEKPVLGRYIFIEVDPTDDRHSFFEVRKVNGIESVLSSWQGDRILPTPFPSHWVEGLICRQLAGEWDEIAKGPLPVGARVRIMEGEFADMLATVTKVKGKRLDFKLHGENRYGRENECSVRAA